MPLVLNYTGTRITDAIRGFLTTSGAAYDAASVDKYVEITAAEFDTLESMSGRQAFGLKRTSSQWASNVSPGTSSFVSSMFLPNTSLVGLYPFAFMTKLDVSVQQRVQLFKQQNVVGATGQVAWVADSVLITPPTGNYHKYFVLKRPSNALPANTSIAVDGFNNGYGSSTGGTGVENTSTGSYSGVSANDNNALGFVTSTVTSVATGAPSAVNWTNYRILLAPKQW